VKKKKSFEKVLFALNNYVVFFILVAFVTTCCMLLFINVLTDTLQLTLTEENIAMAAKLTFWNVVLLSFVFTLIDVIRRKITVERPVRRITDATEKMIRGDFSVRIKPISRFGTDTKFNEIIDCFNKMAEELSGVETLRTDFIANVSHEMKTPLAVMQNFGTLLQNPDLPAAQRIEYAKGITDGSRRISDMMTNILKLNRLENQQIYPKATEYNVSEQLCECLLSFEDVWESRGLNIETEIENGVRISSDADLLSLVWNNLFSNAFKFTERGGTVSLSLRSEGDLAVVTVSDTGCGMTPEVGAHIFEKFYQGDHSHSTKGNGLGLALVKRVVDIMKGEIRVESVYGKGSSFTVKIGRNVNELEKDR